MPTAFWGTLQIQHQRGGQVWTQREVLGHLQEAGELQEDEDRLRGAVQLGSWGQGEKEANVKRTKCHHFEALLQVKQEEEWRRSFLYCGMFLSSAVIQIQNAKELIVV